MEKLLENHVLIFDIHMAASSDPMFLFAKNHGERSEFVGRVGALSQEAFGTESLGVSASLSVISKPAPSHGKIPRRHGTKVSCTPMQHLPHSEVDLHTSRI